MARRRSGLKRIVRWLLVAIGFCALLVGGAVGVAYVRADPAVGDDRARAEVGGGSLLRGSRLVPARAGQDEIVWDTAEGGQVRAVVNRIEVVRDRSEDFDPRWPGTMPCQEILAVERTVAHQGPSTWSPAEELQVQMMNGPFDVQQASDGADSELLAPLDDASLLLEGGQSVTGVVLFHGGNGDDWSGNLVISTADGAPVHVGSTGDETSSACGRGRG